MYAQFPVESCAECAQHQSHQKESRFHANFATNNCSKEDGGIFGIHVNNYLLKIVQRVHNITTREKQLLGFYKSC